MTIRTRGSVSFNQRLKLVADIPVQDRWIAQQPRLAGLRGRNLSVRIHGTLQEPRLDERAMRAMIQQTLRSAAEGMLQHEVKRQLNQLLPSR